MRKKAFQTRSIRATSPEGEVNLTMTVTARKLKLIVGKTIAGIVSRKSMGAGPLDQLFLVFTDNTYLELYGDVDWLSRLEVGDLEIVKQYAARFGGNVKVIT